MAKPFYNILPLATSGKRSWVIAAIVVAALLTNANLTAFHDVTGNSMHSKWGVSLFALITGIAYAGGVHLLWFTNRIGRDLITKSKTFRMMGKVTSVIQYALIVIIAAIIVQMFLDSHYSLSLIILATALSTIPYPILVGYVSYSFFLLYRSEIKDLMFLFIGIASALGIIGAAGNVVVIDILISERPPQVGPELAITGESGPTGSSSLINMLFFSTVALPLFMGSIFEWAGISLMLRHFATKVGKVKYWMLVSIPLLGIVVGTTPITISVPSTSYLSYYEPSLFTNRVILAIGSAVFAIMMGTAYYSMARSVRRFNPKSIVADYMTISAFAVVMISIGFAAPSAFITYPPFGAPSHWYLALASYLFSIGFYSSAISVAQDAKLRRSIRKFALEQSKLLQSLGESKMKQEIEERVIGMTKARIEDFTEETGVQPSLNEKEIKQYLSQVLQEIDKRKKI